MPGSQTNRDSSGAYLMFHSVSSSLPCSVRRQGTHHEWTAMACDALLL